MTVATPPTSVPNSSRPPEDDLDELLRAYFKAEMPDPWPSFEAPAPRTGFGPLRRPTASRLTLWRSRLALAAAILLLITGALCVIGSSGSGGKNSPISTLPTPGDTTANTPSLDEGPFIPLDQTGANGFHQQGTIPRH